MKYEQQDWVRVTRAHPCQVCGRDHFCTVSPDGMAALCTKIKSGKERETMNGPAWIHVLDGSEPARPKPQKNGIDWGSQQAAFRSNLTDELRDELAAILGVDSMALGEIGLGYDAGRSAWTFPMFDDEGGICGITWRQRDGKKQHYGGSSVGLYRRVGAPDDGPVAIVEGASDTAAVLSYGEVDVIGLPSACAVVDYLVPYVRDREVIVIGDNDSGAGKRSVEAVEKAIAGVARSVSTVFPPAEIKDVRAWRASGVSWRDIEALAVARPKPMKDVEDYGDVIDRWLHEGPMRHEPTGFPTLDHMTRGGLVYGTVTVLNGAPDASKTMLVSVLADRFLAGGGVVGLMGIDEDADGLTTRALQRLGWTRDQIEARDPLELKKMRAAVADIRGRIKIFNSTYSIEKAAKELHELAQSKGLRAMFLVDSLQTSHSALEGEVKSAREQVTLRMMALKQSATTYRFIVVTTSEMPRSGYDERGNPVSELVLGKESGSIEYQGKIVISVRPVKGTDDRVRLYIAKNKIGWPHQDPKKDGIFLRLDKPSQTIHEVDAADIPDTSDAKNPIRLDRAAKVAVVLAEQPGLGTRKVRACIRSALDSASQEVIDDCLYLLRVLEVQGRNRAVKHYLDGSQVSQDILNLIPLQERPKVLASRPPARPEADPQNGSQN